MQQSNFDSFADDWWNKDGSMKLLHSMNETRMLFILERILNRYSNYNEIKDIFKKKKILDLGCGGGILAESLAKRGGDVTGFDISKKLIKTAQESAKKKNLHIDYNVGNLKKIISMKKKYDIIISLEVIEHVPNYILFLKSIFKILNKNGIIIISTINRNFISYFFTIFIAENLLKLVPKGTHDWNYYLKPAEIIKIAKNSNLRLDKLVGLFPLPSIGSLKWIRIKNYKSNYILSLTN